MLNDTFIFKGKRADSMGLTLQSPITLSPAEPNVNEFIVPGRNGVLYERDGSYKNRTITVPCYILSNTLDIDLNRFNSHLIAEEGYFRFEDTTDEKHYMLARATSSIPRQPRMGVLNPFILEFDAKPQRFLKSGEKAVDVTTSMQIRNYTAYDSKPLISVTGSGSVTLKFKYEDGTESEIKFTGLDGDYLIYDAEKEIAYNHASTMNYIVYTDAQILIKTGLTEIETTGDISDIKITPRWWEL